MFIIPVFRVLPISLFFSILLFSLSATEAQLNPHQGDTCDSVGILPGKDSAFLNTVYLIKTDENFYFRCNLETPVCNDTLCQVVLLKVFWDLVGTYLEFDTLNGFPLTKNDHIPFTSEDYKKLHSSLQDVNSILGRKTENELLDKTATRYSEKIDGVTGATSLQIKNAVVDGAMYSTYTLWHLVNGPIQNMLTDYTLKHYNKDIESQLLASDNPRAIIMALRQWEERDYRDRFAEIITIMRTGHPLINFYIAKNLPVDILTIESNKRSIQEIWELLDQNTKSVLSNYL